ncbi:MAG: hypothetical protein D6729_12515 [Deltaproteobacteria bacterium]|nr:MAG: hypothetical protein D6729_12515 [Deltaproteobacteria bacterium]
MYDGHLQRLADWATGEAFRAEVEAARSEFFTRTGQVHEEDQSFESRMAGLLEYYLFDRPLDSDGEGRTPARAFLDRFFEDLTTDERSIFRGFTQTRIGLFEVRKIGQGWVRVRDLFEKEDLEVSERRAIAGLDKGEVFSARLVPWHEKLLFGRSFVFHPGQARRLLLKEIKLRRKRGAFERPGPRQALVYTLMRTALQVERQSASSRTPPPVERLYAETLKALSD